MKLQKAYTSMNILPEQRRQFMLLLAQRRAEGYQGRVPELFAELLELGLQKYQK